MRLWFLAASIVHGARVRVRVAQHFGRNFGFGFSLACVNFSFLSRSLFVNYNNVHGLALLLLSLVALNANILNFIRTFWLPNRSSLSIYECMAWWQTPCIALRPARPHSEQIQREAKRINKKISKWKHIRWITFLFFFILKSPNYVSPLPPRASCSTFRRLHPSHLCSNVHFAYMRSSCTRAF